MDSGLNATNPALVAAFWSALLHQLLIVAAIVVVLAVAGVANVHDLHVWTITSGREALSAHVIHAQTIAPPVLLQELRAKLHDRFGVDHLTIQMETPDYEDDTFHFCHAGTACFRSER